MKPFFTSLLLLATLTGCQYFSYFQTNTTEGAKEYASAKSTCEALGSAPGSADLDWCIDREKSRY